MRKSKQFHVHFYSRLPIQHTLQPAPPSNTSRGYEIIPFNTNAHTSKYGFTGRINSLTRFFFCTALPQRQKGMHCKCVSRIASTQTSSLFARVQYRRWFFSRIIIDIEVVLKAEKITIARIDQLAGLNLNTLFSARVFFH